MPSFCVQCSVTNQCTAVRGSIYPLIYFKMYKIYFGTSLFSHIYKYIMHHKLMLKIWAYMCLVCYLIYENSDLFNNPECVLEMPSEVPKIFREPEYCDFCDNIIRIDKQENISPEDFHMKYALTGKPLIVTDGMRDWTAQKVFTFDFFKNLYESVYDGLTTSGCQFFPYKTEFKNLREVFAMSKSRANLDHGEKPWYVGWSNCIDKTGKSLRQFYSKPYFLGNYSENIALSWIFMGGPGNGAQMHIDNVLYPSWQAQLNGKKLWKLAPPPECYNICPKLEVVVEPGEIIVIDTNRWYHQTTVLLGDLSITIGSEFD